VQPISGHPPGTSRRLQCKKFTLAHAQLWQMSAAIDLDDVPKPHSTPLAVAYYISKHVLQSADGGPATLGEFNMTIKAAQWMGRRLPDEVDLHRRIGTNTDSERYIRNAPVITQLQKMFYEKSLVNDRADEKEPSDPDDVRLSRQERFLVAAYFVTSMYSSRKRADKELAKDKLQELVELLFASEFGRKSDASDGRDAWWPRPSRLDIDAVLSSLEKTTGLKYRMPDGLVTPLAFWNLSFATCLRGDDVQNLHLSSLLLGFYGKNQELWGLT